jgi:hypothetical protein
VKRAALLANLTSYAGIELPLVVYMIATYGKN